MKQFKIPQLSVGNLILLDNTETVDCFYAITKEKDKIDALKLIEGKMGKYKNFNVNYDFRVFTKLGQREWSHIGNVMLYENKDVNDSNRIVSDGIGNYECVLWMSANAT